MTDRQFISYRRDQLDEYKIMLEVAKKIPNNDEVIKLLENAIRKAESDVQA